MVEIVNMLKEIDIMLLYIQNKYSAIRIDVRILAHCTSYMIVKWGN